MLSRLHFTCLGAFKSPSNSTISSNLVPGSYSLFSQFFMITSLGLYQSSASYPNLSFYGLGINHDDFFNQLLLVHLNAIFPGNLPWLHPYMRVTMSLLSSTPILCMFQSIIQQPAAFTFSSSELQYCRYYASQVFLEHLICDRNRCGRMAKNVDCFPALMVLAFQ